MFEISISNNLPFTIVGCVNKVKRIITKLSPTLIRQSTKKKIMNIVFCNIYAMLCLCTNNGNITITTVGNEQNSNVANVSSLKNRTLNLKVVPALRLGALKFEVQNTD